MLATGKRGDWAGSCRDRRWTSVPDNGQAGPSSSPRRRSRNRRASHGVGGPSDRNIDGAVTRRRCVARRQGEQRSEIGRRDQGVGWTDGGDEAIAPRQSSGGVVTSGGVRRGRGEHAPTAESALINETIRDVAGGSVAGVRGPLSWVAAGDLVSPCPVGRRTGRDAPGPALPGREVRRAAARGWRSRSMTSTTMEAATVVDRTTDAERTKSWSTTAKSLRRYGGCCGAPQADRRSDVPSVGSSTVVSTPGPAADGGKLDYWASASSLPRRVTPSTRSSSPRAYDIRR